MRLTLAAASCFVQQADAAHLFMALALPFLQAVLKTYFLPQAPLLNFMRALSYGFALGGVTLIAIFVAWLTSDESHGFKTAVPALCVSMQLKKVRCAAQPQLSPRRSMRDCCTSLLHSVRAALTARVSQSSECLGAIFAWAAPALAGGWCIILAALSYFISRSHEETGRGAASKLLPFAVRACPCNPHRHTSALAAALY